MSDSFAICDLGGDINLTISPIDLNITVLGIGEPGPIGPAGADGSGSGQIVTASAAQALGGHRALAFASATSVDYLDPSVSCFSFAGISTGAADSGSPITAQAFGVMTEPSWTWTAGNPVYAAANGTLTQTVPTTGFLLTLGIALSATALLINPQPPIALV